MEVLHTLCVYIYIALVNLSVTASDYVHVTVYAYLLSLVMKCSGRDRWLVGTCVHVALLLRDVISVEASFCGRVALYDGLW